jgi:hypothetical protein
LHTAGELIALKLRDLDDMTASRLTAFITPSNITITEFLEDVSKRTDLPVGTFDVVYQDKMHMVSGYVRRERSWRTTQGGRVIICK